MYRFFLAIAFVCLVGVVALPTVEFTANQSTQQAYAQQRPIQAPEERIPLTNDESDTIELEIVAPREVAAGDLVVLSVESNAVSYEWIVLPSTDNFLVIDGGRRAVFSARDENRDVDYTFVCAAAKGDKVKVTHITIRVKGGATSAVSSKVRALCEKVDDSPTKKGEAQRLSQSFLNVVVEMQKNPAMSVKEIGLMTRAQNQLALGDKMVAWTPFAEGLKDMLYQMAKAGELKSVDDHIKVWKEIADTLRAYGDSPQ